MKHTVSYLSVRRFFFLLLCQLVKDAGPHIWMSGFLEWGMLKGYPCLLTQVSCCFATFPPSTEIASMIHREASFLHWRPQHRFQISINMERLNLEYLITVVRPHRPLSYRGNTTYVNIETRCHVIKCSHSHWFA